MHCTKAEWNAYMKEWRSRPGNQERQNKSSKLSFEKARAKAQQFIDNYKLEKGCKVCGYKTHPEALDLDHRNPEEKKFVVSRKVGNLSLEKLKEEIEKCDVLCANCHRIRHLV